MYQNFNQSSMKYNTRLHIEILLIDQFQNVCSRLAKITRFVGSTKGFQIHRLLFRELAKAVFLHFIWDLQQ